MSLEIVRSHFELVTPIFLPSEGPNEIKGQFFGGGELCEDDGRLLMRHFGQLITLVVALYSSEHEV